jgi:hypothetical protein
MLLLLALFVMYKFDMAWWWYVIAAGAVFTEKWLILGKIERDFRQLNKTITRQQEQLNRLSGQY